MRLEQANIWAGAAVAVCAVVGIAKCVPLEPVPTNSERILCEQAVYRNNFDRNLDPGAILDGYPYLTFDRCVRGLRQSVDTPKP